MKKHRVKEYHDKRRSHLKFVVNTTANGKRSRQFFETKKSAESFAEKKDIELLNGGLEAVNFSTALRVEALECAECLKPFGKTLRDAVQFYLPHLKATNRNCTFRALIDELVKAKGKAGASE